MKQPKQLAATWRKVTLILLVGSIVGLAAVLITATIYKNQLRTRINTIASALDTDRVQVLRDTSLTQDSAIYEPIKAKLAAIKQVNSDVRFVYLMARNAQGQVYFLADSEPADSEDYSPRGEVFPEASAELQTMFANGKDLIEGPSKDSYGEWLSALAPVVNDRTHGFVGVVGIDVPVSSYNALLGLVGGIPILLALLTAVIVYGTDQTRRRRQELLRFRAEMVSIASHELRTPLTGLRWSEESLLNTKLAKGQHETVREMYDSTLRLQESIEEVLQLASLESAKAQQLAVQDIDLKQIIDAIIDMQKLAAARNNITVQYASGWPHKLPIRGDYQRLKRVFNNLISNAIKYSKPDLAVTIGYQRSKTGGHIILVRDHGIGIPANEQGKVFGGFYRASNATASVVPGTGMGLYLSQTVVAQHHGKLWLESIEGKGTTVFVELP